MDSLKILFASLGCDKNSVDTEMMLGIATECGYEITSDENEADIVVVNTCCFILDAKEESINTLIEFGELKKNGKLKVLIATGCLAQRYAKEIHEEIPEVDSLLGTSSFDQLDTAIKSVLSKKSIDIFDDIDTTLVYGKKRVTTNGGFYAYLKIAEGCDKRCTYCVIPSIRGKYRSVPMEALVKEAKELADKGVKELILVAQETTVYGLDIYGKKSLHTLIRELAKIDDIKWIRLLYCYPEEIDDNLIAVMRDEPKVCHYIDMPIQHADDFILQKMGRRTNRAFLEEIINKLRTNIEDICIRTTLITGFPGETSEMFENLYDFVDAMEFDRLGVFPYSAEEGTLAEKMENQVPEEIKISRRDEIMELQQEIAFAKAESKVGMVMPVMIEGRLVEDNILVARSYMDAPDVDGYIFIDSDKDLESGTVMNVRITGSNEYDLIGEFEDEDELT